MILKLFKKAMLLASKTGTYNRLLSFEKVLQEKLNWNKLLPEQETEIKRTIALVNIAQIQVTEKELNTDIDGDGKIAGKKIVKCAYLECSNEIKDNEYACEQCLIKISNRPYNIKQDNKMKLVFMYDTYYPCGGWHDFKGTFETEEEIFSACEKGGHSRLGYNIKFNFRGVIHEFETLMIVDLNNMDNFKEYNFKDIMAIKIKHQTDFIKKMAKK